MKILHVISSLDKTNGGLPEFVKNLASQQNKNGKISHIVTTNNFNNSKNYKINLKKKNIYSFKRNFFKNICYSSDFKKFINNKIENYDLIHIHGLYRFPTIYAAYKSFKKKKPYVISPHGSLDPFLFKQSKKNIILKRIWEYLFEFPLLKKSTAIHSTCEVEKKKLNIYKFKTKIFVIPLCISNLFFKKNISKKSFRKKIGLNKKNFNIVFIGRLNFKKGLDILIPAFKKIRNTFHNTKLIIVGPNNDKYYENFLMPLINKYNLSNDVIYHKPLYNNELTNCYKDANLFVLPSYTENFGLTIFEAMSQKVPVIVSDQIDMAKDIKENNIALICKCNINSISKNIKFIINNKRSTKSLIKRAYRFVKKNLSSTSIENEFTKNYNNILKNS